MDRRAWMGLAWRAGAAVLLRRQAPIIGSVIVTDRCSLHCQHCAVANLRRIDYLFPVVQADLRAMFDAGVRVVLLYGGEPTLWRDGDLRLADVVAEARHIGFPLVGVVTNGLRGTAMPGVDLVLVSVDGTRAHHDLIRGPTYDRVMAGLDVAPPRSACLYMAVNRINVEDIEAVGDLARRHPAVRGVAFNLHTPYPGTEHLALVPEQRRDALRRIGALKRAGAPVLDLVSALPAIAQGSVALPCAQCVVREDGHQWVCGRCVEVPGLCGQCGFLFAGELAQVFAGRPRVVLEAARTYGAMLR